jgi:hypothetical protein
MARDLLGFFIYILRLNSEEIANLKAMLRASTKPTVSLALCRGSAKFRTFLKSWVLQQ